MMPSFWQIALVLAVVVLLFGRGKIKGLMTDVAEGIKGFKKGMKDDGTVVDASPKTIDTGATPANEGAAKKDEAASG